MIRRLEMIMKLLMTKLQVTRNSISMKPVSKVALVLTSDSMKLRTVWIQICLQTMVLTRSIWQWWVKKSKDQTLCQAVCLCSNKGLDQPMSWGRAKTWITFKVKYSRSGMNTKNRSKRLSLKETKSLQSLECRSKRNRWTLCVSKLTNSSLNLIYRKKILYSDSKSHN